MNSVVLLGTRHSVQRDHGRTEFTRYLENLVKRYDVKTVAEEIDKESVAAALASRLRIDYKIIEPTPEERKKLGILSENEIECSVFFEYDDIDSQEAQSESASRKQSASDSREKEWLERVKSINNFPVLVICGAFHFQSFGSLLRNYGFQVTEECGLWE